MSIISKRAFEPLNLTSIHKSEGGVTTKLSTLIQFYDSFWGRRLQKCLQPYWRKRTQQPTLALGFGLPWMDMDALYAIPTQYGGNGIVWPKAGPCQTVLVDASRLPIDDRSIGTLWAMHMLDEVPDLWLNEASRILAHDGQIHMVAAQAYHPLTRSWPFVRLSRKDIYDRLADQGWHITVRPIMGWPRMLWHIKAQKLPYYAVKKAPNGSLIWMES